MGHTTKKELAQPGVLAKGLFGKRALTHTRGRGPGKGGSDDPRLGGGGPARPGCRWRQAAGGGWERPTAGCARRAAVAARRDASAPLFPQGCGRFCPHCGASSSAVLGGRGPLGGRHVDHTGGRLPRQAAGRRGRRVVGSPSTTHLGEGELRGQRSPLCACPRFRGPGRVGALGATAQQAHVIERGRGGRCDSCSKKPVARHRSEEAARDDWRGQRRGQCWQGRGAPASLPPCWLRREVLR